MEEVWKDIKGYEGKYQISSFGRVKTFRYRNSHKVGILKPQKNVRGYLIVDLKNHCNRKHFTIHRLVAQAFIPNPDNLPQVNHKDEDKTNNHVENLEWCTNEYNYNYGTARERLSEKLRSISKKARKPVICTDLDGNFIKEYESVSAVEEDGHSCGVVSMVCRGLLNKHHNMLWHYAS